MRRTLITLALVGLFLASTRPAHAEPLIVRDGFGFSVDFSGLDMCFILPETLRDQARCGPLQAVVDDVLGEIDSRSAAWLALGVARRDAGHSGLVIGLARQPSAVERVDERQAQKLANYVVDSFRQRLIKDELPPDIAIRERHELGSTSDFSVGRAKVDVGEPGQDVSQRGPIDRGGSPYVVTWRTRRQAGRVAKARAC